MLNINIIIVVNWMLLGLLRRGRHKRRPDERKLRTTVGTKAKRKAERLEYLKGL